VSPLFFPEKPGDLFCSSLSASCHYHYRFLLLSLGCHSPPPGCHPTPFLPVRPRFSTIFCKFAHKIFSFGCHPPPEGVTRGGPPPCDATVYEQAPAIADVPHNDHRRHWTLPGCRYANRFVAVLRLQTICGERKG